jgi:ATP-dependent Zn protease
MLNSERMKEEPPRQNAAESAARLTATAYHEAGHAVMALILGRPIQKVTIAPSQLPLGSTRLGACEMKKGRSKSTQDWLEDDVLILLAGMVAESQLTGRYCELGATSDLHAARRLLSNRATNQKQLERQERRAVDKVEHLLSEPAHLQAIEQIAMELVQLTTISGRQVRHMFEQIVRKNGEI